MILFVASVLLLIVLGRYFGGLSLIALAMIPARVSFNSFDITAFELAIPLYLLIELRFQFLRKGGRAAPAAYVSVPVVAFCAFAFASGTWASSAELWLLRAVVLAEALAAGWAVYLAVSRLGGEVFVRVFSWAATIGASWSLVWFYLLGRPASLNLQPPIAFESIVSQSLRLGSPLVGPSNYYAGFLVLSIPIAFWLLRQSRANFFHLLIQSVALVATLSRGGVIALVVAAAIASVLWRLTSGRLPHGLTVVAAIIGIIVISPRVPSVVSTLLAQRQQTTFAGTGYTARTNLWQVAIDLWRADPILGIGAGGWNGVVDAEYGGGAHNVLLQILAELGMFGLLLAILSLLGIFATILRISNVSLRYCIFAAVLGSFINCLAESTFEGVVFTWVLGAMLGGVLATSGKVTRPND